MSANAVVRARIDEQIKEETSVVLAAMGLTLSDALRMMLVARFENAPYRICRADKMMTSCTGTSSKPLCLLVAWLAMVVTTSSMP